ncbi:MAG: EamA family transporter [Bacteroidia bacterium]
MFKGAYKNYFLLHITIFIWGFTGILGKLITLPSSALVWYRMLIGVVFIFFYLKTVRLSTKISTKKLFTYFGIGLIIALHWLFFYASIKAGNVSVAVVCLSCSTFFTSLIEPIIYKRKIIFYEMIFGLLVIVGIFLIFNLQKGYSTCMYYGITSAFFASFFPVLNGKLMQQKHDPVLISFYEMLGGFLGLSIYFLATQHFTASFFQISMRDSIYLLVLGSICTAFTFIISVQVMKEISPFTVVLSVNLEPVYSIILAYFIFGESEHMTIGFYLGALFILSIIVVNAILKRKKRQSEKLIF